MEFINHFRLSGVGIHLLIYCQVVTGSVVSALGAGRGRQVGANPLVLQREPSQGKEPALGGSSCLSPPLQEGLELSSPEAACPDRCQVCCFWHQSNTFMSHLSSYHFFSVVVLSPLWKNRFSPSFSSPALAVCFQAAVGATCCCPSIAAQWWEPGPLSLSLGAGWAPCSSASPSFFWGK